MEIEIENRNFNYGSVYFDNGNINVNDEYTYLYNPYTDNRNTHLHNAKSNFDKGNTYFYNTNKVLTSAEAFGKNLLE